MSSDTAAATASAAAPHIPNIVDAIERQTTRRVGLESRETNSSLSKCHTQECSPLFSLLPRELRDSIWEFATAPYEDQNNTYSDNEYYFRPGHIARHKTDTALLRTCRRVWLETHAMPMLQAEHCFWYERAAPDQRDRAWMARLTASNRENFGHLHLFAQMYTIEPLGHERKSLRNFFLESAPQPADFQPRMLHVTIRHTDWWHWETEAPLKLDVRWVQALLNTDELRSTQTLKLELETLDYKRDQLAPIVDRLLQLESKERRTHVVDGREVSTRFVAYGDPQVSSWSGPANIDANGFDPYAGKDKLTYHIVTLTWRLRFPDIPTANVAQMRRAPRTTANMEHKAGNRLQDADNGDLPSLPVYKSPFSLRPGRRSEASKAQQVAEPCSRHLRGEAAVRWCSMRKAEAYEGVRRKALSEPFARWSASYWSRRWEEENSLLMFVE